jgi:glycosyltransferase involved in cell wall biosynthesis
MRAKIEATAKSLNIPFTIQHSKDVRIFYSAMDVFVLPSYTEGVPYACLEAMAMSKPVIVTDVGATRDLIQEGKNGFLIPKKSPRILADKITELIKNENLKAKMGHLNRKIVEQNFTLQRYVTCVENVYKNLVN